MGTSIRYDSPTLTKIGQYLGKVDQRCMKVIISLESRSEGTTVGKVFIVSSIKIVYISYVEEP